MHAGPFGQELTVAMAELAKDTGDARTRWSIWNVLGQAGHEDLLQPALEALANDPDERVRDSVVRALAKFIDGPDIREALQGILIDDPSPLVRKSAEETLQGALQIDTDAVGRQ